VQQNARDLAAAFAAAGGVERAADALTALVSA
jgi:hypothetical protein